MNTSNKKPLKKKWYKNYIYFFIIASLISLVLGIIFYLNSEVKKTSTLFAPLIIGNSIGLSCFFMFLFFNKWIQHWASGAIKYFIVFGIILLGATFGNELGFFLVFELFTEKDYHLFMFPNQWILNTGIASIIGITIYLKEVKQGKSELKIAQQQLKILELEQLKTKSDLEALQAKINPHFLYNALNSIIGLIKSNPDKAEDMVLSLSHFFRLSINEGKSNFSSVKDEINVVQTYLNIEKLRFDEHLECAIHVDKETEDYLIPSFLLQPLVENAIKHGVSKITKKGLITVNIKKQDNEIHISIGDNGPEFPEGLVSGYGLQSTQEKLRILFPKQHEIQLLNGNSKNVKIILKKLISNKDVPYNNYRG